MAEYSKLAQGSFTSTGFAQVVNLPFQPNLIRVTNFTAAGTPANHGVPFAYWQSGMGQGFAVEQVFNATPVLTTDTVVLNGFSTFAAGTLLQYGPLVAHGGSPVSDFSISKANPAVVTTVGNHGLTSGQVVIFENLYQTSTTGMPQIAAIPFTVTVTGATTFTIPWNTNQSNYTAFNSATSTGNIGSYKVVLYPYLYLPSVDYVSAVTTGTTTTITTTTYHDFVVGQEIAFRIPQAWGITQLNALPNPLIPGSPIYGYVTAVNSNVQFVCNINSSAFTPFNSNPAVSAVPGLTFPQVLSVGDVNSGGWPYTGGALYPSPTYPTFSGGAPTINGPAVQGAFVNNTSQGFIVGNGAGTNDAASVLVGAAGNLVFWEAVFTDM